ncbi:MAG: polyprenyl synthetase family protein [Methanotrichaceae archaeon]|nr:polyprenyl synthetase family protein [Methanotrichaceae archaeon]
MSYEGVLDSFGAIIESDLRDIFSISEKLGNDYHPHIGQIIESIEEFVLRGGRRLAACSTLIAYRGYRGKIDDRIVRVCSGIELYRHAILIHDDIADKDMLRRGGETLQKALGKQDEHLGLGSALFAGNIVYSMSLQAVLDSGYDHQKTRQVAKLLAAEYMNVNESQILDLFFEYREPGVAEWEVMVSKRASSLFRAAMLAGAILASASDREITLLGDAAKHIGFAFDIQDDIIDTFATREQYGRDPCGDISKGKKPLHIAIALQRDKRLASFMQKKRDFSVKEIGDIQDLIRDCGALETAKVLSRSHAREAERLISETLMNEEDKAFFISFIKYIDESLEWYK